MSKKPGRGSDQFPLRLPPGMREQIKQSAEASGKSMNEEILDVLREYFPEQPGFHELVEQIDYTIAMLEALKVEQASDGLTPTEKVQVVLGRLDSTNDHLRKLLDASGSPSVFKLDKEVAGNLQRLLQEWDLGFYGAISGVVNGLLQMSIDRVLRREDNIRVTIGDGDARRVVELIPPWEEAGKAENKGEDDVGPKA